MGLVKVLFTADHLPIVYLTLDELEALIRRMGLWPATKATLDKAVAPVAAPAATAPSAGTGGQHRPDQLVLGLDVAAGIPATPAANAVPVAASPPPVPASAPPATEAPHGVGVHPAGPEELKRLVSVMCEMRSGTWLAKRLDLSSSQVNRMAAGKRGASPRTMERLHELALTHGGIGLCRDFDWAGMKAACAARAHHLPKQWRVGNGKAVAA